MHRSSSVLLCSAQPGLTDELCRWGLLSGSSPAQHVFPLPSLPHLAKILLWLCPHLLFVQSKRWTPCPPSKKANPQALHFPKLLYLKKPRRLFCEKLNWVSFSYHEAHWKMEGRQLCVLTLLNKSFSPSPGSAVPLEKIMANFSCQKLLQNCLFMLKRSIFVQGL